MGSCLMECTQFGLGLGEGESGISMGRPAHSSATRRACIAKPCWVDSFFTLIGVEGCSSFTEGTVEGTGSRTCCGNSPVRLRDNSALSLEVVSSLLYVGVADEDATFENKTESAQNCWPARQIFLTRHGLANPISFPLNLFVEI